jgi:hypothetical protein
MLYARWCTGVTFAYEPRPRLIQVKRPRRRWLELAVSPLVRGELALEVERA